MNGASSFATRRTPLAAIARITTSIEYGFDDFISLGSTSTSLTSTRVAPNVVVAVIGINHRRRMRGRFVSSRHGDQCRHRVPMWRCPPALPVPQRTSRASSPMASAATLDRLGDCRDSESLPDEMTPALLIERNKGGFRSRCACRMCPTRAPPRTVPEC